MNPLFPSLHLHLKRQSLIKQQRPLDHPSRPLLMFPLILNIVTKCQRWRKLPKINPSRCPLKINLRKLILRRLNIMRIQYNNPILIISQYIKSLPRNPTHYPSKTPATHQIFQMRNQILRNLLNPNPIRHHQQLRIPPLLLLSHHILIKLMRPLHRYPTIIYLKPQFPTLLLLTFPLTKKPPLQILQHTKHLQWTSPSLINISLLTNPMKWIWSPLVLTKQTYHLIHTHLLIQPSINLSHLHLSHANHTPPPRITKLPIHSLTIRYPYSFLKKLCKRLLFLTPKPSTQQPSLIITRSTKHNRLTLVWQKWKTRMFVIIWDVSRKLVQSSNRLSQCVR